MLAGSNEEVIRRIPMESLSILPGDEDGRAAVEAEIEDIAQSSDSIPRIYPGNKWRQLIK